MLAATAERGDARPPMLMMVHPSSTPLPGFVRARGGVRLVVGATPARVGPADDRGERRLPGALPEGRCLRGRADQHGRRHDGRRPHDGRRGPARRRRGGSDDPGRREDLPIRRRRHGDGGQPRARPRQPPRLAAAGADPVRRRAASAATWTSSMADDARLTLVESVVFGRLAMGEEVSDGAFRDRWRIRRGGRLVFAEDVRLEGPIAAVACPPGRGQGRAGRGDLPPRRAGRRGARRSALGPCWTTLRPNAASAPGTACSLHGSCHPTRRRSAPISPASSTASAARPVPRSWQT